MQYGQKSKTKPQLDLFCIWKSTGCRVCRLVLIVQHRLKKLKRTIPLGMEWCPPSKSCNTTATEHHEYRRIVCLVFLPFQVADSVCSYHHTIKSTFLGGFRNRRVDVIIYTLVERLEDYYRTRRVRQGLGFEGENVEEKALRKIRVKALLIPDSDIKVCMRQTFATRLLMIPNSSEGRSARGRTRRREYHLQCRLPNLSRECVSCGYLSKCLLVSLI
jgi:hypothetical protein